MKTESIRVWDPLVRGVHWSLVALFAFSWFTSESATDLHVISGYCLVTLVLARLIWGLVGSRHARFSTFVRPPAEVFSYVRGLVAGKPEYFEGHNPLGGWMIIALLSALLMTGATGLLTYGSEGLGPFAGLSGYSASAELSEEGHRDEHDDDDHPLGAHARSGDEAEWEDLHEFFASFTLALVFLHVAGVLVASLLHRENLIRAMLSGSKPRHIVRPSR